MVDAARMKDMLDLDIHYVEPGLLWLDLRIMTVA